MTKFGLGNDGHINCISTRRWRIMTYLSFSDAWSSAKRGRLVCRLHFQFCWSQATLVKVDDWDNLASQWCTPASNNAAIAIGQQHSCSFGHSLGRKVLKKFLGNPFSPIPPDLCTTQYITLGRLECFFEKTQKIQLRWQNRWIGWAPYSLWQMTYAGCRWSIPSNPLRNLLL